MVYGNYGRMKAYDPEHLGFPRVIHIWGIH